MDPIPKQTIEHFAHPGHQLEQVDAETEYTCDGCKTPGQGLRYQCSSKSCYYVLHDYCGTCPLSLSSFMHPQHPLTLVVRKPQQSTRQNDRRCNVCRESVEGLFYRCKDCDFDVHPLCNQLPPQFRHELDQSHPLIFEAPVLPSPCSVCGTTCSSWRYRCGVCGLDIHLECLSEPCVPPTQQRSARPSGPNPNPPPPYPPPPPYGGYGYAYGAPSGSGSGVPSGSGYGGYSYAYGAPSGSGSGYGVPPGNMYNNGNQAQGHDRRSKTIFKLIFKVVLKLALGLFGNMLGLPSPTDFLYEWNELLMIWNEDLPCDFYALASFHGKLLVPQNCSLGDPM